MTKAPDLLETLRAACGYLLNAKIDLETGCTKATAIKTINDGLERIRAAIAGAEDAAPDLAAALETMITAYLAVHVIDDKVIEAQRALDKAYGRT